MNKGFHFHKILMDEGWTSNGYVHLDHEGKVLSIQDLPSEGVEYERVNGIAIPGFVNAHSHAFQYAMAGLAEIRSETIENNSFWTWRNLMYQIALGISPHDLEAIATQLYSEMLRSGYTHVAEFHYLHHDKDGQPYNNISELGERLIAAARNSGIKITLIPILYRQGGFQLEALPEQKRFISSSLDEYLSLLDSSIKSCSLYEYAWCASGAHSLRAVSRNEMIELTKNIGALPFHMHISEQIKEVEECEALYGLRPADWMLENFEVDGNFNFVHATHLTPEEVERLTNSGAQVILCPSTEGNLGDGFFPIQDYMSNNGNWCIGTDSHVGLNPFEEIRLLDYGRRLISHKRNTFIHSSISDSGFIALKNIYKAGQSTIGNSSNGMFNVGSDFDALILDASHPLLASSERSLSATIVYSSDPSMYLGTMICGDWKIRNNKHKNHESFAKAFIQAIHSLDIR